MPVVWTWALERGRNEKWWQGFEPEWLRMPFTERAQQEGRGGGLPVGTMDLTGHRNDSCKAGSLSTPSCQEPVCSFVHSISRYIETSVMCQVVLGSGDTLLKKMNFLPKLYQGRQKIKHKQRYDISRGKKCSGEKIKQGGEGRSEGRDLPLNRIAFEEVRVDQRPK